MASKKKMFFIVFLPAAVCLTLAALFVYVFLSWEYGGCFSTITVSGEDSRMLTRVGGGGIMILWDVKTRQEVRTFQGSFDHIAFSPDGRRAVTGGTAGVFVWNLDSGEMLQFVQGAFPSKSQVSGPCTSFSPDGKYFITADTEDSVILWDAQSYEEIRVFERDSNLAGSAEGRINAISFSPDGRLAVSAGERLILWDVSSGRMSRVFKGHENGSPIVNAIITPDGRTVISGGWDAAIRMWSIASGEEVNAIKLDRFQDIFSFSADGQHAATASSHFSDSIMVWDFEPSPGFRVFKVMDREGDMTVSICPDGRRVAVGLCGRVELLDLKTGVKITDFKPECSFTRVLSDFLWSYVKM